MDEKICTSFYHYMYFLLFLIEGLPNMYFLLSLYVFPSISNRRLHMYFLLFQIEGYIYVFQTNGLNFHHFQQLSNILLLHTHYRSHLQLIPRCSSSQMHQVPRCTRSQDTLGPQIYEVARCSRNRDSLGSQMYFVGQALQLKGLKHSMMLLSRLLSKINLSSTLTNQISRIAELEVL